MSSEGKEKDQDDLRQRVRHIEKKQEEQSQTLKRIENAVIGDEEIGRQGIGKHVRDHEERLERLERFRRKVMTYGTIIGGTLSALGTFFLYHWPNLLEFIKSVFSGTGKS